jgi:hypothetical protein
MKGIEDVLPDVRDGLTREERIVLYVLNDWGRVCEHFYISPQELSEMLARLGARRTEP